MANGEVAAAGSPAAAAAAARAPPGTPATSVPSPENAAAEEAAKEWIERVLLPAVNRQGVFG